MRSIEPTVNAFKLLLIDFPIAIALVLLIENNSNNDFSSFFKNIFVYSFLVAGVISIFLLLNPSINEYVKSHILRTLDLGTFQKAFINRGFGLSDSLLYTYPIAIALGACYIFDNVKNKILSISYMLIATISILLNARIGLIPIIVYFLFISIIKRKLLPIGIGITVIFMLFQYLYKNKMLDEYSFFIEWNKLGFEETMTLFSNKELSGNYYVLSKMIYFPENLLFGSGKYIFTEFNINSDIGYILQIYYGGIIHIILIFTFFYILIKRISSIVTWKNWFPITVLITIIISNFKGNFFSSNPGIHTILFLYVFFILYSNLNTKTIL